MRKKKYTRTIVSLHLLVQSFPMLTQSSLVTKRTLRSKTRLCRRVSEKLGADAAPATHPLYRHHVREPPSGPSQHTAGLEEGGGGTKRKRANLLSSDTCTNRSEHSKTSFHRVSSAHKNSPFFFYFFNEWRLEWDLREEVGGSTADWQQ